jgi:predicted GNAT family acetyltransferase
MSSMDVQHSDDTRGGAFFVVQSGARVAELTYVRGPSGVVTADHTFTDPSLRGRGVAKQLLEAFVSWIAKEGFKVVPACSYVARAFDENPAYASLRARG